MNITNITTSLGHKSTSDKQRESKLYKQITIDMKNTSILHHYITIKSKGKYIYIYYYMN